MIGLLIFLVGVFSGVGFAIAVVLFWGDRHPW